MLVVIVIITPLNYSCCDVLLRYEELAAMTLLITIITVMASINIITMTILILDMYCFHVLF